MLNNLQAALVPKPGFDFLHDGRYGSVAHTAVNAFLNRGLERLEPGMFRLTVCRSVIRGRALLDGVGRVRRRCAGGPRIRRHRFRMRHVAARYPRLAGRARISVFLAIEFHARPRRCSWVECWFRPCRFGTLKPPPAPPRPHCRWRPPPAPPRLAGAG